MEITQDSLFERQTRLQARVEEVKKKMGEKWIGHPKSTFTPSSKPKVLIKKQTNS